MAFPFVEKPRLRPRPLLIASALGYGPHHDIFWAMMITSATNSDWPEDIPTGEGSAAMGLPLPCYIRPAKIAAVSAGRIERKLGTASDETVARVRAFLNRNIG